MTKPAWTVVCILDFFAMKVFAQHAVSERHDIEFQDIIFTVKGKKGKLLSFYNFFVFIGNSYSKISYKGKKSSSMECVEYTYNNIKSYLIGSLLIKIRHTELWLANALKVLNILWG